MAFTVFHSPEEYAASYGSEGRTVLSVGNFDGLHLGHRRILQMLAAKARSTAQRSVVVTFDPHPLRVLRPEHAPQMIQTLSQRLAGIELIGIDTAVILHFDRTLSLVSPEDFIRNILFETLRAGTILVGANFRYGHRAAGDIGLLTTYGKLLGFEIEIVPPVVIHGQVVSSTAVRNAIASGNVTDAAALLGRAFSLTGKIGPGAGRGHTILFPTLNLVPEQELIPMLGVYATESIVEERTHPSVTNVGTRPTFGGEGITVESHLFGFDQSVVEGPMEVRFHSRIRDERKFPGIDALRAQIARDIEAAQKYFAERSVPENSSRS